ncbi:hypothetical protein EDB89DRAFT_1908411 [Lactarius sanguifluus]|nr:hypothetical protein EDB89DRAFT_1908411 [Lactarius sanguifluus]
MVDCRGCGRKRLKRSGITQHCYKSNDPRCMSYLAQLRSAKLVSVNNVTKAAKKRKRVTSKSGDDEYEDGTAKDDDSINSDTEPIAQDDIGLEPRRHARPPSPEAATSSGANHITPEMAAGSPEDEDDITSSEDSDEDDKDSGDSDTDPIAQDDIGLEPQRHARPPSPEAATSSGADRTTPEMAADDNTLQRRGEVGPVLERRPKATRYPGGNAGVAHSKANMTENQKYETKIGDASQSNPYAPFASSLDWQIAKWAKLRGPSSTAFTEMMAIEGVSQAIDDALSWWSQY